MISGVNKGFDTSKWENIQYISAGMGHLVGLCEDGTVLVASDNAQNQADIEGWFEPEKQ